MIIEKTHFSKYILEIDDDWYYSVEGPHATISVEETKSDRISEIELAPEDIANLILHMERLLIKLFNKL